MSESSTTALPALASAARNEDRHSVFLHGRPISVELTRRAWQAADALNAPLIVEMELFFSCLIRKRVLFHAADQAPPADMERIALRPFLLLQFRPIVSEVCRIDELEGTPPVMTMPAKRADAFVPKWLKIDYRAHEWVGEFGY